MIATIVRVSWMSLRRDRLALILTFLLPVIFYSIFAAVFGAMDQGASNRVPTAVLSLDASELATGLVAALERSSHLEIVEIAEVEPEEQRQLVADLIRVGRLTAAVVIPADFAALLEQDPTAGTRVELLIDSANPIAVEVVSGVLQASVLEIGYGLMMEEVDAAPEAGDGPLQLQVVDVLGADGKRPSIAFFAAGIGVMFLLFSVSGRSAILIRERESGVLTRMLASRVSLRQVLVGRWLFLTALGFVQVSLMFVWGSLAFGLDLWTPGHLAGFVVMTAATAAAAAAFGILLASGCRTRAQLNGIAAVVILIMSALGGSMFPRFLMPERLQKLGLMTFNAWALDGYQKVFWYELPLRALLPEVAVLVGLTVVFLAIGSRLLARWAHD
jgi:ABC-2 type transport system permease protein